jgi:hypothetical protein
MSMQLEDVEWVQRKVVPFRCHRGAQQMSVGPPPLDLHLCPTATAPFFNSDCPGWSSRAAPSPCATGAPVQAFSDFISGFNFSPVQCLSLSSLSFLVLAAILLERRTFLRYTLTFVAA